MSKERTNDACNWKCNWNLTVGALKDYDHVYVNGIRYTEYQPDINTQYLLDQVARLTAENAMLKEKRSTSKQPEQEKEKEKEPVACNAIPYEHSDTVSTFNPVSNNYWDR